MEFQSRAMKKEAEKESANLETMLTSDLGKEIEKVFLIFDEIGNKRIDLRNVPHVVRGLGCVPSEAELEELLAAMKPPDNVKEVTFPKFLPPVYKMICEGGMKPASKEELYEALRRMDTENRGYIRRDWLEAALQAEGERFSSEEAEAMMRLAVDPDSGHVPYEYYVNQLAVSGVAADVYSLVPDPEAEKRPSSFGGGSVRASVHESNPT